MKEYIHPSELKGEGFDIDNIRKDVIEFNRESKGNANLIE